MSGSPAVWLLDLAALAAMGLLGCAALSDLATRTIPDQACIALALLGAGMRLYAGLAALAVSAGVAAGVFAVLVLVHARGALGGGDVKLIGAVALGLAPAQTYRFLVATILTGGLLGLLHLALRHAPPPARCKRPASSVHRIITAERWRIRRKGSLPYGIAIACGGAWVLLTGMGG